MRWLFSKRSGSQKALVENKVKNSKKPLLWSLFCTTKRSNINFKRPLREGADIQKSRLVQQRRRSSIYNKLDIYRLYSNELLSNSTEKLKHKDSPKYPDGLPIAFCPTCHTNVVPVFEKDACQNQRAVYDETEDQKLEESNEYAVYAIYEPVYENSLLSIDTDMEYGADERAEVNPVSNLETPLYLLPTEPLAFSTTNRKAFDMDDSQTVYDEVASDSEDDSWDSLSLRYYDAQRPSVLEKHNNKAFRKRGAYPESDSYQQMKRIRREVFVCEE
ncbi:unnamed protein product [Heterobilharzia americana]|nr:unnamed protein product [Heterobilharzia americana]